MLYSIKSSTVKDNKKFKQAALTTPCSHTAHLIHSSLEHVPISWESFPKERTKLS